MNRLVLGLGNPGDEYRATRHNVGFRVVEELARRWRACLDRLECNAVTARVELAAEPRGEAGSAADPAAGPLAVLLAQPQTYMNRSGFAARCLVELHGLAPEQVLVVYDEVNLPFGRLRLRRSGSPAGHRGIESILENLRTDQVPRLRIGIAGPGGMAPGDGGGAGDPSGAGGAVDAGDAGGDPGNAMVAHVLSPFTAEEEEALAPAVQRAADACEVWLRDGIDAAMRQFNGGGGAQPAPPAGGVPENGIR
ncbi:MAG TPA: aminoacyl-tRNA hydrolase [Thermoanaerobaculia bacterium]|nr:aminoacyl-tRNA hydrolase [Thermoanaerobaculia bacterium]